MASPIHLKSAGALPDQQAEDLLQTLKLTTIDLVGGIKCNICRLIFSNKKEFDAHYPNHNKNTAKSDIVYTCVKCNKESNIYRSFQGHCYLSHVMKDKFQCEICSKKFSKKPYLNSHMVSMHKFICTVCNEVFPTLQEKQMHDIVHKNTEKPPYDCLVCSKSIKCADTCEIHSTDHAKTIYSCPICKEILLSKEEAKTHFIEHYGDAPEDEIIHSPPLMFDDSSIDALGGIVCYICDKLLNNREEFDSHFDQEHEDMPILYSCNICGKEFKRYSQFGDHCYSHKSKDRYECMECGSTFPRLSLLVLHGGAAHGAALQCAACGRRLTSRTRYYTHMRAAHRQRRVRCPDPACIHTFNSLKDLIFHEKIHKKTENWCRYCGLTLLTLAACENHMPIHAKKIYNCPVCDRKYRERHKMLKHITAHFEVVLHVCRHCGKSYNAKGRLAEHMKTHSENRFYKCTHCEKSFVKRGHLQQHLTVHTGVKAFGCIACPKMFADYRNLCKHLRKQHNFEQDMIKKVLLRDKEKADEVFTKQIEMKKTEVQAKNSVKLDASGHSLMDLDNSELESDSNESELEKEWENLQVNGVSLKQHLLEENTQDMLDLEELVNSATFAPDVPDWNTKELDTSPTPALPPPAPVSYPPEYGPDFTSNANNFEDLNDLVLPHIDPLLTINPAKMYVNHDTFSPVTYPPATFPPATHFTHVPDVPHVADFADVPAIPQDAGDVSSDWEPPVITKFYPVCYDSIDIDGSNIFNDVIF